MPVFQVIFMVVIAGMITTGIVRQFEQQALSRRADVLAGELRSLALGFSAYRELEFVDPDDPADPMDPPDDTDLDDLRNCSECDSNGDGDYCAAFTRATTAGSDVCHDFFMPPVNDELYEVNDNTVTALLADFSKPKRLARMVSVRLGGVNVAPVNDENGEPGDEVSIDTRSPGFSSHLRPWLPLSGRKPMTGSLRLGDGTTNHDIENVGVLDVEEIGSEENPVVTIEAGRITTESIDTETIGSAADPAERIHTQTIRVERIIYQ